MSRGAAAAVLLAAFAAAAQEEPTPFWMPPPPPKEKPKKPPAEKKKKKPAPEPQPQAEKPKEKKKPVPEPPTWIEATPPPAPAPVVKKPVPPAPQPTPVPAQQAPTPMLAPAPILVKPPPSPPPAPPIAAPPIAEPPAPVIAEQETEPSEPSADIRNWKFALVAGGWARSRSDGSGHTWDAAYGLHGSYGFFDDSLEVELDYVRSAGTEGSPFVSTTTTHNLFMLRAFWVLGDRFALLLGGGGGAVLAQTHYTLTDVASGNTSSLDANAVKPVIGITAAGRVRVIGGLQARVEVTGMVRDGRVELLPLLGLGWSL